MMGFAKARADARAEEVARRTLEARRILVARSSLRAAPLNIINALLLSVFMVGHTDLTLQIGWVVALSGAGMLRLLVLSRARRANVAPTDFEMTLYILLSGVVGSLWGATPFLLGPDTPSITLQAVALTIAGMTAGAAMTSAADQRVVLAYSIPSLGIWAASLAVAGTAFGYLSAGLLLLFFVAMRGLSVTYAKTLVEAVETNVELEESRRDTEAQSQALTSLAERHEAAARAAEEQARTNAAVLANMSHELGTPLNGILGMAQLLTASDLPDEPRRMVRRIHESGESLSRLVNDILDISRIEAGRLPLHIDDMTAEDVGGCAERFMKPLLVGRPIAFDVRYEGEADRALRADENRVMQIARVYLANAARFTDEGEITLTVSVKETSGEQACLRLEVCDTGCGVPESARGMVFNAFAAEKMDASIREAGTALGLHLVARLADLMNGRVGYAPADQGSVFWVELGLRLSSKADRYTENERMDMSNRRLRVLVGEKDSSRRSVLLGYLKSFNCVVTCATSSAEMGEALNSAAFDAVVVGLELEDSAPDDAVTDIRTLPSTASLTPLVRMESDLSEPVQISGGDVFVRAPVAASSLLEGLRAAVDSDPVAAASLRKIA